MRHVMRRDLRAHTLDENAMLARLMLPGHNSSVARTFNRPAHISQSTIRDGAPAVQLHPHVRCRTLMACGMLLPLRIMVAQNWCSFVDDDDDFHCLLIRLLIDDVLMNLR